MADVPVNIAQSPLPAPQLDRVRQMSTERTNRAVDARTNAAIELVTSLGPGVVEGRLARLQTEWDVDRVLMCSVAAFVLPQLVAARKDRRWLWGPILSTPILLMHATAGWSPPALWFHRLGFRTRGEIQAECDALRERLPAARAAGMSADLLLD